MNFEIDVSGSDLFTKNYTIVVAAQNNDKIMLAYKFTNNIREMVNARHRQGMYNYPNSKKGMADLKIRLYCVTIYYLFKELQKRYKLKEAEIDMCRDFSGNEADIKHSLTHLLGEKLGLTINIKFGELPEESIADNYAFLIRHDQYGKLKQYCRDIQLQEFEVFLKK